MSLETLVGEFFDRVHAGDLTVCEMFAADGVRVDREGRRFHGREAIGAVYAGLFPLPPTHPEVVALLVNPPYVAAVMQRTDVVGPAGQYIDLFDIRDGLIQALWVLV